MFNNIDCNLFELIKNELFEGHDIIINNGVYGLNRLYNHPLTPKAVRCDILDIYLNDVYNNEFDLNKWGF